ncbi:hypothetical protein BBJ28_00007579 [Nothophytophthora sp. Chile5]|nr:hypothetical protein BBJ28_00007579 [Nothophytophthora sp. Chile5]
MRAPAPALLLLAAAALFSQSTEATGTFTVAASSSSSSLDSDDATVSFTDDSASSAPSSEANGAQDALTPIATAVVDSSTFAVVDSYNCNDTVVNLVENVCSVNRAMFDTCVEDSGYQIFPYSGVVPDADAITGLVDSAACTGVITTIVLLNTPACIIGKMPLRAVCETLLYYSVDMEGGATAPTAEEFHDLMAWRRDSDLAKEAGAPYDSASTTYAAFTKNLRLALSESAVTVLGNYTIIVEDAEGDAITMSDGAQASFGSSSASLGYDAGTVEAGSEDTETEATQSTEATSGSSTDVNALTSSALSATSSSSVVCGLAMAITMALACF